MSCHVGVTCAKTLTQWTDLSTRLSGKNPTNSVVIPQSLVWSFFVLGSSEAEHP